MLHLFDKVYIETDSKIDIHKDRIVISQESGYPMYEALDKVSGGYLLMYGKTLEEVLSNNNLSGFDDLIEFVYNRLQESNTKVIFYLDETTFVQFITNWFKRIFLEIDSETAWSIVDSYLKKDLREVGKVFLNNARIYPTLNQETFTEIFSSISVGEEPRREVYDNIVPKLSLEYLTASYLYNGSFEEELSACVKKILVRALQDNVLEVKAVAYRHFDREPFLSKIDEEFLSNSSVFKAYPVGFIGEASSVDLIHSSDEDIDTLKNLCKTVYLEWDKFSAESPVIELLNMIDIVRGDINKQNLDYILNFEKNSAASNRIYADDDRDTINIYLLHHILNTDPSGLRKLLLR